MNPHDDAAVEYIYDEGGSEALKWVSIGFGIGLVVGGIVGLLMAPKSGEDTRDQLRDYASDLSVKGRDLAQNLSEKGRDVATKVSDKSKEYAEEIRDKSREYATEIREKATDVAGTVRDAVSASKEAVTKIASTLHSSGNGSMDGTMDADKGAA
ncbi:MAG: YtxH domain-containing protein [bacterium]